jgi:L-seryl-tRNA(Ser) seleniumtransferase
MSASASRSERGAALDGADRRARVRELPSVDRLAAALAEQLGASPAEAVAAARAVLEERRARLLAGEEVEGELVELARERLRPSLRRVLNGTGVVIHTNLGRAPLAEQAAEAVAREARGYSNLELDLAGGRRGAREEHVRGLLRELTGAEDGFAVNNGAGAALLALAALAGGGRSLAVSRGQLVEIGGGFRIPEVLAQAGAEIVEVGTTNRTRLGDYERALAEHGVEVILRVHQSNFRTVGFVEEVAIEQLCRLGVPVVDDIGSGALLEDAVELRDEPSVRRSVAAGVALVCFSGDKLLGGPQAGLIVGRSEPVARARRHPLARALRIGRLPLAALEATLSLYRDPRRAIREIPVLAMLGVEEPELERRARRLADAAAGAGWGASAEVTRAVARVGGGALPLLELEGSALALQGPDGDPQRLAAALREADPPLLARIAGGRVLVDPRTLSEHELGLAAGVIAGVLGRSA